jgi:16S rRNA (guanine527-N7)-methyltransferase
MPGGLERKISLFTGSERVSEELNSAGPRLNSLLVEAGMKPLEAELTHRFEAQLSLILRWNARVNLTAIRDEEGILARHFVESIACACTLPAGIQTLLDFGSGAGFPGLPIALCRPEIAVTLADSQGKKAAFLREAVRVLGISAQVHSGRAELLSTSFDCVILRAVDRMEQAVQAAARLVRPGGWLALMTTGSEREKLQAASGPQFSWLQPVPLPGSEERVLALGTSGSGKTCV